MIICPTLDAPSDGKLFHTGSVDEGDYSASSMNTGPSFSIGGANKSSKLAFGLKGQPKAAKPAVFSTDSDNEDEEPKMQQERKRQRRTFTGSNSLPIKR